MTTEIVNCETCGGAGFVTDIDLGCCGNLTRGGECRGDCAVPLEIQKAGGFMKNISMSASTRKRDDGIFEAVIVVGGFTTELSALGIALAGGQGITSALEKAAKTVNTIIEGKSNGSA